MGLKLYCRDISPACRAVYLVLEALGLKYEKVLINVFKGDQLTPEFLKRNPQHIIPTLVDDKFVVWDSHAIVTYLVSKYGKTDSLYPKDLEKRAIVNQRLHYDSSVICKTMLDILFGVMREEQDIIKKEQIEDSEKIYDLLNTLLKKTVCIAGDHITVADYNIVANIASLEMSVPIDSVKYSKLTAWLNEMKRLPFYEIANQVGVNALHDQMTSKMIK